jgi:CheY-like chemotaxis protein
MGRVKKSKRAEIKRVLIVDDENLFLRSVADGLKKYSDTFRIRTARNGKVATRILDATKVDLVVTDVEMPMMDGFELLAYMTRKHPDVPAIVMTAFGNRETEKRTRSMGAFEYLEKPLDIKILADKILDGLFAATRGYIQGITLPAFLQMLEMERKTCTLAVSSGARLGRLYFQDGIIMDAEVGSMKGEDAAREIIFWERPKIEIEGRCVKTERTIGSSLSHLLLEGARLQDEQQRVEEWI